MAYKRQSAQPVVEGGSGISTATVYAPLVGGTTNTSPFQSVALSSSGNVLVAAGSSAIPTFQHIGGSGTNYLYLHDHQSFGSTTGAIYSDLYIPSLAPNTIRTFLVQIDVNLISVAPAGNTFRFLATQVNTGGGAGNTYNAFATRIYNTNSATPILVSGTASTGVLYNSFTTGVTYRYSASIWIFNVLSTLYGNPIAYGGCVGRFTITGSDGTVQYGSVTGGGNQPSLRYTGLYCQNANLTMTGSFSVFALREYV